MEERTSKKHDVIGAALGALRTLPPGESAGMDKRLEAAMAQVKSASVDGHAQQPYSNTNWQHGRLRAWAGYGAVVTGIVTASLLFAWSGWTGLFRTKAQAAPARTYATRAGERALIHLADGSTIRLAPESKLFVSAQFGKQTRGVTLVGEAVFTVTTASGAPFKVLTRGTVTQVLGTAFGVRAYPADTTVRIAVAEGKVSVRNGPVLGVGDVSQINDHGDVTVVRDAPIASLLSWTQGRLMYRGATLSQVADDIERWYGVTIHLDGKAMTRRVTADFDNDPLKEVLNTLADIAAVHYSRTGDVITISANAE